MSTADLTSDLGSISGSLIEHIIISLLGVALLFPWNAYLKAFPYFSIILADSNFQSNFPSYITTTYTLLITLTTIMLVVFRLDKIVLGKYQTAWLTTTKKIFYGLLANLILISIMALFPTVEYVRGGLLLETSNFFIIVLVIIAFTGVMTATMMNGLYEMISMYPAKFTPTFVGGQAVAGVLASTISLASTILSSQSNAKTSVVKGAIFYFVSAALIVALSFAGFLYLENSRSYMTFVRRSSDQLGLQGDQDISKERKYEPVTVKLGFTKVLAFIADYAVGIFAVLAGTISLIASYIPSVKSTASNQEGLWARIFLPVVFFIYDLGDLTGRWFPCLPFLKFKRGSRMPIALPWLRILFFVPIFMLSDMHGTSDFFRSVVPIWIRYDFIYLFFVFLFGASNGYCCTLLILLCPDRATKRFFRVSPAGATGVDECRAQAGSVMGLFINIGLVVGSLASFGLRALASGKNPFK